MSAPSSYGKLATTLTPVYTTVYNQSVLVPAGDTQIIQFQPATTAENESVVFRDNIFGCYNGGSIQCVFAGAIGLNCSGNSFVTSSTTPCPTLTMVQWPVLGPISNWQNNRWTQGQLDGTQPIKQLTMPKNTNIGLVQATQQ